MPRDVGTGIYHYPDGTPGNPGQTVFSARYNTFINDLSNTLNQKLPINMGGTGADNATTARDNLDAERSLQIVTNYDTQAFESGSLFSAPGATAAPNSSDSFFGIAYMDPNNGFIEARSLVSGKIYIRKKLTTWGSWIEQPFDPNADYVNVTGDTMSGPLVVTPKGSTFGGPSGTAGTGAVTIADANILLYNGGAANWCGMGCDTNGWFWLRVGTGGTPVPALLISPGLVTMPGALSVGGNATVSGNTTLAGNTTNTGTLAVSGAVTLGGALTVAGTITSGSTFASSTSNVILAATGGGVFIRPNGAGSVTGQVVVGNTGNANFSDSIICKTTAYVDALAAANAGLVFRDEVGNNAVSFYWNRSVARADIVAGSAFFMFHSNAQAYKAGGGVWGDYSDTRIKNVLGDYNNGLDAILQLQPVRYTFKGNDTSATPSNFRSPEYEEDGSLKQDKEVVAVPYPNSSHYGAAKDGKEFIGLIAQAVEGVMPEMVSRHEGMIDGQPVTDMRELDTGPLIFALVNAVKTLTARIEALEAAQATP